MHEPPAPRYAPQLPVRLVPTDLGDGFPGVTLNISQTGALVRTDRLERQGTRLRLEFPTFSCLAEVVWNREAKGEIGVLLGMKFVSLGPEDRERLAKMLGGGRTGPAG